MNNKKRVFLIVLDSFGIGEMPDANKFGDEGSNTLCSITKSAKYNTPNLLKFGLFNIDGVKFDNKEIQTQLKKNNPSENLASYAKMTEASNGKDTTIGHWEIAGIISKEKLPTFPNGFPSEIIDELTKKTGCEFLCNKPYSGTKLLQDYGEEHLKTHKLIIYTSADSVLQIAAHEDIVPVKKLYEYCKIAREIMTAKNGVGRIIARPFLGDNKTNFKRTTNRHDFSLLPPSKTMLDVLKENDFKTIGVGKIYDIFAGVSIDETYHINNNEDGMKKTISLMNTDFNGLCFVNLVDFDMLYGHRNDIDGYANAATVFDSQLGEFFKKMKPDDIAIITADHGCDPATISTDHSREYVPMLIFGDKIKTGINLKTRNSFADISATILDIFSLENKLSGESFLKKVMK